jgi:hypothetical protein
VSARADEDPGPGLSPVPLAGLAERIEQVARARIDEPLYLTFNPIDSATQPGLGYLVVLVPASPRAPHMVEHRYWGRGDKTKYRLSDAEVERLMALRERWAADAERLLRDWMAADPIPADSRANGHLFITASPVPQRQRLLLPLFADNWPPVFQRLVSQTTQAGGLFEPGMLGSLSVFSTTADGWAWSSYAVFGERREREELKASSERRALTVEICEDGRLRLMCGRATDRWQDSNHALIDPLILGLAARMVSLAACVSAEAGFLGSWDFGVGITGLRDSRVYSLARGIPSAGPPYTADAYIATTRATVTEIEAGTGPVVERLLGRLMRAFGADQLTAVRQHFGQA